MYQKKFHKPFNRKSPLKEQAFSTVKALHLARFALFFVV